MKKLNVGVTIDGGEMYPFLYADDLCLIIDYEE